MAKIIKKIRNEQESVGIEGDVLVENNLKEKMTDSLVVSGGYISTERDEIGNILLYEDLNNIGNNKKSINQYISIDVMRKDLNDEEVEKVFDTEINELFKSPKNRTADELRVEIERLRNLLANAEAQINITGGDGSGGTDTGDTGNGDNVGFKVLLSGTKTAPFILTKKDFSDIFRRSATSAIPDLLPLNDLIFNIQTAIWNSDNQGLEHLNSPNQQVKYEIMFNNSTKKILARFESIIKSSEKFRGWYFDSENLGNTQNYMLYGNTNSTIEILTGEERKENKGIENEYTFVVAYADEMPQPIEKNSITIQMEEIVRGELSGIFDGTHQNFNWAVKDDDGNFVDKNDKITGNPFVVTLIPGNELRVSFVRDNVNREMIDIKDWYTVNDNGVFNLIESNSSSAKFIVTSDIKRLVISYEKL